jgi:hypothetical protein
MKKKGTIYIREFFSQAKLMFLLILTGGAGEVGAVATRLLAPHVCGDGRS